MLVAQEVSEGADEVHVEDVNAAGVAAEGAVSDDVNVAIEKPYIPSPTPHTLPPQTSQDIPSTSQVKQSPPQHQPQPSQDVRISMDLLHTLLDTCTTLTKRVKHLEQDKIAQALDITKLKQRVKQLERRNKVKVLKLRRLKKFGTTQKIDTLDETVMDDVSKQEGITANIDADEDVVMEDTKDVADVEESADDQGRQAESQAQIYKIDLEHASKVLSMQEEESEPAKFQEVVDAVTTAKIITEVVTAASDTITAASTTITAADALNLAAPSRLTAAPRRRK
uniref:Uncharacterized protein n=1 Tax=Tanacetum cinerariifolium TaxID=118510 RepID=A0A699KXP5_TANCI|nr:hypothetical protein [Tanacetum cinerariifolium]